MGFLSSILRPIGAGLQRPAPKRAGSRPTALFGRELMAPARLQKSCLRTYISSAMRPKLTPILKAKLKNVSSAIVNKPPLCSGTWETPSESFQLSFRTGGDLSRYMDIHLTGPNLTPLAGGSTFSTRPSHNSNRSQMHVLRRHLEPTIRMS